VFGFFKRSKPQAPADASSAPLVRDLGRQTYAGWGDVVGRDFEDEHRDRKVADNVGAVASIIYASETAEPRELTIDGIYGRCIDSADYVRGPDSRTGENRTFRVDRIVALVRQDGSQIRENIPWWIGALARNALGLELTEAPRTWSLARAVRMSISSYGRDAIAYEGQITAAELRYGGGPFLVFAFTGRPLTGARRLNTFEVTAGPGADRRVLLELIDLATGEVVDDVRSWLDEVAQQAGANGG
jgi:hypothetical protein